MTEQTNVKLDQGGVNRRILAKEATADYRRVEQASIKQRARFESPEAKRLFVRFFHSLQINAHFVSEIARTRLAPADVEKVEGTIRTRLESLAGEINRGIDGAAALFSAHAVTAPATYDTLPMELDVGVISSLGRRYLEAIQKLDRLMPMIRTLEIYEVISTTEADKRRALLKKQVRGVATATRLLAAGLRRRMNEQAAKVAGGSGKFAGNRSLSSVKGQNEDTAAIAVVGGDSNGGERRVGRESRLGAEPSAEALMNDADPMKADAWPENESPEKADVKPARVGVG